MSDPAFREFLRGERKVKRRKGKRRNWQCVDCGRLCTGVRCYHCAPEPFMKSDPR